MGKRMNVTIYNGKDISAEENKTVKWTVQK